MLFDLSRFKQLFGAGGGVSDPAFGSGVEFAVNSNTAGLGVKSLYSYTGTGTPRTLTVSSADIAAGSPTVPWIFKVKDKAGAAGTDNFTIATQGVETIDGVASIALTVNFASVTLYSDGFNLFSV